jgi:hypothetical protein
MNNRQISEQAGVDEDVYTWNEIQLERFAELVRQDEREQWDTSDMAHRSGGLSVEQEPVVEVQYFGEKQIFVVLKQLSDGDKLYTAPPKREWVGLTDEEIAQTVGSPIDEVYLVDFRRVIEKLRSKNT